MSLTHCGGISSAEHYDTESVGSYSEISGLLECAGQHASVSHVVLSDTTVAVKTEVEEVEHLSYESSDHLVS